MTSIRMGKDEALHLAAYLGRIVGWDERAAVRVQARGGVVGIFAPCPLDVLVFVALPLSEPVVEPLDTTVSAGRLRDVIGDVARLAPDTDTDVTLPDAVTGSSSLAVLPPTSPWAPGERGMAGDVIPKVDEAVAKFRASVPSTGSFQSELLAEAAWDAPGWGGVPMRALHAARLVGFLTHPGARIETGTTSGWKRFSAPGGQVFVRNAAGPVRLRLGPRRGPDRARSVLPRERLERPQGAGERTALLSGEPIETRGHDLGAVTSYSVEQASARGRDLEPRRPSVIGIGRTPGVAVVLQHGDNPRESRGGDPLVAREVAEADRTLLLDGHERGDAAGTERHGKVAPRLAGEAAQRLGEPGDVDVGWGVSADRRGHRCAPSPVL